MRACVHRTEKKRSVAFWGFPMRILSLVTNTRFHSILSTFLEKIDTFIHG